jgi:phosphoadenosine phosphosulfate reductase
MWNLIPKKLMPPTRLVRYCCSELKEGGNSNRMIATGVRWAESKKRSRRSAYEVLASTQKDSIGVSDEKMLITDNDDTRRLFESCQLKAKTVVNPIIDWSDEDIWNFINDEKINVCEMYSWGYERLGCIGCPLARKSQREREFYDFPKYKNAYIKSFERMLEMRKEKGKKTNWTCGEEVYLWWMQSDNIPGQMNLTDFPEVMP